MSDEDGVAVGLAEAIATVRVELERAIAEGEQSALAFRPGPVEMEFQVTFSKTGSTEAGVRAWVVTAGAKGQLSNSQTHRLRLSLTPLRRVDGGDPLIGSVAER
jgi:Trypsin-co-occurring domain 2